MIATLHKLPTAEAPPTEDPVTASQAVQIAAERFEAQAVIARRIITRPMFGAGRKAAKAAIKVAREQIAIMEKGL